MTEQHLSKSKTMAALLAFFLGTRGLHRFHLSSWGVGLVLIGATLLGAAISFSFELGDLLRLLLLKHPNFDVPLDYERVEAHTF